MENSRTYLKDLLEKYKNHEVSVFVGAGFSRNAYSKFPLWGGLLKELVLDIYGEKIKSAYDQYLHSRIPPYFLSYSAFEEQEMWRILDDKGYLNVVSEYIRKKKSREAIDVYIEEHIPFLKSTASGYELTTDPSFTFTEANLEVHADLLSCNWLDVYTTNYDNLLEEASKVRKYSYRKVVNDYDLGNGNANSRNIIKLHGDLVENSLDAKYEFDNDKTLRYIIAQEDYDTYPKKHEAFTQLMRISMLKGVFLLVGFSGEDPNFIAWLNWMKDVLDREQNTKKDDKKIYLLVLNRPKYDKQKDLFYKNHRIGLICMDDDDFVAEITGTNHDGGMPIPNLSTSEKFHYLFKYLRNTGIDGSKKAKREYNQLWSQLDGQIEREGNIVELINEIKRFTPKICNLKDIMFQERVLEHLLKKKDWTEINCQCANAAIGDMGVLGRLYADSLPEDITRKFDAWDHVSSLTSLLENKYKPIENPTNNDAIYHNLLYYAYNLNVRQVKYIVDNWNPSDRYVQMWSIFCSYGNKKRAVEKLDEYIASEQNIEDRYNASHIRNCVDFQIPLVYNCYEYSEIDGFREISEKLIADIQKNRKTIKPHGWHGHEYLIGHENAKFCAAIRFLSLMQNTGIMPSAGIVSMVSAANWYNVFEQIYVKFPYPSLFYSLQIRDEKILTRIGQDFAYSEYLYDTLPDLSSKLLNCIANQEYFGNGDAYWIVLSEMLVAVNLEIWIDKFAEVIDIVFLPNILHLTYMTAPYKAVKRCLEYISDSGHKQKVVAVFVKHAHLDPIGTGDILANMIPITEISEEVGKCICGLIESLPISKSYLWDAVLLENKDITESIADIVAKKIVKEQINPGPSDKQQVIHTLSYLTNGNSNAIEKVKAYILSSDIWNCGVTSPTSGGSPMYLDLSKISKDIVWTQKELKAIADNVDKNLTLLESISFHDGFFTDCYARLLNGIINFVNWRVKEDDKELFFNLKNRAVALLAKLYDGNDFYHALSSDDTERIAINGNSLLYRIERDGFDQYLSEVMMFMAKAMNPQQLGFQYSLSFVSYLTDKYLDELKKANLIHVVISILSKYSMMEWSELDLNVPNTFKWLIHIAENMQSETGEDTIVKYWTSDNMVLRFNIRVRD